MAKKSELKARTAGAIELTKCGYVRAVRADPSSIYRQTEILRLLDAQAGVIQFGKAVAFSGNQSITTRKIYRTRRPVGAPSFPHDGGKIIPVPSIPHVPPNAPGALALVTLLDAGIALSVTRISAAVSPV